MREFNIKYYLTGPKIKTNTWLWGTEAVDINEAMMKFYENHPHRGDCIYSVVDITNYETDDFGVKVDRPAIPD